MPAALTCFTLDPVPVERPWGGRGLAEFGKTLPRDTPIGESWEVADLPAHVAPHVVDPRSRVADGAHLGSSLAELIARFGPLFLGSAEPTSEGDFPLLVKLLDANQHLSVQVHPDAAYVADHPETRLKTESWYVVRCLPGSELFLDLRAGVEEGEVADALGTARFVDLLGRVPAEQGQFVHLPAGLVHALGAGVMVAEVQTPSDTTFRMYDWSDEYGRAPRALHLPESLEALRPHPPGSAVIEPMKAEGSRTLEHNSHYWIREHRVSSGPVDLRRAPEIRVLMAVEGAFTVDDLEVGAGTTAVVPAVRAPSADVVGAGVILEVGLV